MTKKKKIILVIDDEVDLVEMIKCQLISSGYDVLTAHDGVDGIEMLEKEKPDLILLDINMPRMGGIEFCNRILTPHGHTQYPVLILTARASLKKVFQDIEVDGFLDKPFELNDLIKEVERITSKKTAHLLIYLIDMMESPHVEKISEKFETERYTVLNFEDFDTMRRMAGTRKPDFILMEYMQKGMSGEAFIRRLKEDSVLCDTPVIVYSYSGFDECREKSLVAGADKYVGKPEDYDTFLTAVEELNMKGRDGEGAA